MGLSNENFRALSCARLSLQGWEGAGSQGEAASLRHHPGGEPALPGQASLGSMAFSLIQNVLFTLLFLPPEHIPLASKSITYETKLNIFFLVIFSKVF